VKLKIFDILGSEILTIVDETKKPEIILLISMHLIYPVELFLHYLCWCVYFNKKNVSHKIVICYAWQTVGNKKIN
jgi:hypothetical protein